MFSLKNLNPEVIGAALARYSRAPTGFKETVAREFLNPDGQPNEVKGSEMIDRVVNKFGDESVAELLQSWSDNLLPGPVARCYRFDLTIT